MFGFSSKDIKVSTVDEILDSYKSEDGQYSLYGAPSFGSYLGEHIAQSFEDYTMIGGYLRESEIQAKEKEAGQYDDYYYKLAEFQNDPTVAQFIKNKYALSEKDWKASEWYRPGIEYDINMTPVRAKIMAETYDQRRQREALIQAGDKAYGAVGRIAGFGAMMLGGLPDPINFIPFAGGAIKAGTAAKTAIRMGENAWLAGIGTGAKVGLIEGAAGGALSAAATMPQLKREGEDIGFADALVSVAMSAGIGASLGAVGGGWATFRSKGEGKALQSRIDAYWETEDAKGTEEVRTRFAEAAYNAILDREPNVDKKQAKQEAMALACIVDARAHTWARIDMQGAKKPVDYYLEKMSKVDMRGVWGAEERLRLEFGDPDKNWLDYDIEKAFTETTPEAPVVETSPQGKRRKKEKSQEAETPSIEPLPEVTTLTPEERGPIFQEVERPGVRGRDEKLATSAGDEDIHFEVRELDELVPSHNPSEQFKRRQDYPENIQERPYHSDTGEQDKVRRNAANLDPRYLINDNPDASTGAPIVTRGGIVLGGNSRTMSMQLASLKFPEKAQAYREVLMKNAERFGIDPEQIKNMKNPVLVRVNPKEMSLKEMAQASRRYNETTTQALQVEAEGVSKAKLISQDTIEHLNEQLSVGQFNTLRDFLDDSSSKGFVDRLIRDGVIEQTQITRLIDSDGRLKPEGKEAVENALRGIIVPSYDLIKDTPGNVMNKIDRAIPYLAQLKAIQGKWDISQPIIEALTIIYKARKQLKDANTQQAVWTYLNQGGLLGDVEHTQAARALALTLANATPKEFSLRVAQMAKDASNYNKNGGESAGLLGNVQVALKPEDSFIRSFLRPIASSDGELVHSFNPAKNIDHEAIQFILKEGGGEKALEKLMAMKKDSTLSAEELAKANDLMGAVGRISGGKHQIFEPNLEGFAHNPQDKLWQGNLNVLYSSYEARETNLIDFVKRVKSEPSGSKQSFFVLPLDGENKDIKFYITSDMVHHQENNHPSMALSDYENLKTIISQVNNNNTVFLGTKGRFGARFIGKQIIEGKNYGYVFDVNKKGIMTLITFFHDSEKKIESWFNPQQKKASKVFVDSLLEATPNTQTVSLSKPFFKNINEAINLVKQIDQEHFNQLGADSPSPRGSVTFLDDGRAVIEFFQSADFSTAPHEIFHVFRRELEETAHNAASSDLARQRWKDMCEFVGAEDGAVWTREQEEKFVEAGMRYLAEGVAPTPALKTVFDKMKDWFLSLYRNLSNAGVEISPKMRRAFDSMFSPELPRNEITDVVRAGIAPMPKRDLFRAMEKALMDLDNGDPVDVSGVLRDSNSFYSIRNLVEHYANPEEMPEGVRSEGHPDFRTESGPEYPEAPSLTSDPAAVAAHDTELETALHEEVAEGIEQARQEGLLTEDLQRELLENRQMTERAREFDELGQGALECMWHAAE